MPYILAWLLGVPAFVLILIWLFVHWHQPTRGAARPAIQRPVEYRGNARHSRASCITRPAAQPGA